MAIFHCEAMSLGLNMNRFRFEHDDAAQGMIHQLLQQEILKGLATCITFTFPSACLLCVFLFLKALVKATDLTSLDYCFSL